MPLCQFDEPRQERARHANGLSSPVEKKTNKYVFAIGIFTLLSYKARVIAVAAGNTPDKSLVLFQRIGKRGLSTREGFVTRLNNGQLFYVTSSLSGAAIDVASYSA